jgi:hypothetical protein
LTVNAHRPAVGYSDFTAELAQDALVKVLGRPSLTAPGTRSPEVKARVPRELRDRLVAEAHQRGAFTSSLIRGGA